MMNKIALVALLAGFARASATSDGRTRPAPHEMARGGQENAKSGGSREVTVKDGETVTIRLAVAANAKNVLTAVTFPGAIKSVISAWDPKDLSVEHDASKLFLKLLSKAEGHLDVLTVDGLHARLYLLPAAAEFDSHLVLKRAPDRPEPKASAPAASGALELIKSMRLGAVPADATVRRGAGELLFEDDRVRATLLWVYDSGLFRGFVAQVANRSDKDAACIDLSRFHAEDLVLIGTRETQVSPGKATRLYLVCAKR